MTVTNLKTSFTSCSEDDEHNQPDRGVLCACNRILSDLIIIMGHQHFFHFHYYINAATYGPHESPFFKFTDTLNCISQPISLMNK